MSESLMDKARHYCAYRERCHSEVRGKLLDLSFRGADLEQAISTLISEGFLNEVRFAQTYCRSKLHHNQWGRQKIIRQLRFKKVSEACIKKGLKEIDEDDYQKIFNDLFNKKWASLSKEKNIWIKKKKMLSFLVGKGFESELVYEKLKQNGG